MSINSSIKFFLFKLKAPFIYIKAGESDQRFKYFLKLIPFYLLLFSVEEILSIFNQKKINEFLVVNFLLTIFCFVCFLMICKKLKKKHQNQIQNPILSRYEEQLNYLKNVQKEKENLENKLPPANLKNRVKRL